MNRLNCAASGFIKLFYAAILLLIIFTGCATKDAIKSRQDEDILRERVMAYWELKIKGDYDKSFEYEHPLYRKQTGLVNYIRGFKTGVAKWLGADVGKIGIEGDTADVAVKVRIRVKIPNVRPAESDELIQEKWVKVQRVWYHVPVKMLKD